MALRVSALRRTSGEMPVSSAPITRARRGIVAEGVILRCLFCSAHYLATAVFDILHGLRQRSDPAHGNMKQGTRRGLDGISSDRHTAALRYDDGVNAAALRRAGYRSEVTYIGNTPSSTSRKGSTPSSNMAGSMSSSE